MKKDVGDGDASGGCRGYEVLHVSCTVCGPNPGGGLNPKQQGQEGPHTMVIARERRRDGGSADERERERARLFTFGSCHKGLLGNLANKTLTGNYDELVPYQVGQEPLRDDGRRQVRLGNLTLSEKKVGAKAALRSGEDKSKAADADAAADDKDEEKVAGRAGATRAISRGLGDVVGTANGHIHALVWNQDGELWAFGCGSGGRAGVAYYVIGANPDHPRKSRMKAYMSTPNRVGAFWPQTDATRRALESMGLVTALEGKRVLSAATSRYHGVCLVKGS